ncbi:MAG: preprotein translocase subunit SecG [Pseudomonadota bacterium]|jgi:preprotein translocase subunit SecG
MSWLSGLLNVLQVVSALGIIVLVLLQQGKGADMGAAFGSGSSGSVFGASGSANFLSRSTAVLAVVFFTSTLGLSFLANKGNERVPSGGGIMESIPASTIPAQQDVSGQPGAGSVPVPSTLPSGGSPAKQ